MSAASDDFPPPDDEPTRALLLAQALDVCITAERRLPGSADHIIAHQPTWARDELRRLVSLAGSLDAVSTNSVMSEEFRVSARSRLMQRIHGGGLVSNATKEHWAISAFPSTNGYHVPAATRVKRRRWVWRAGLGGVLAATLATTATLTASANALPGEPLYPIKQAREELGVQLAPDDQARALALLNQGDARLNETARLLQAGRTTDIAQTTQRFNEAVDRATTTFMVTIADTPSETPATAKIETKLSAQQAELESLISSAPQQARADLRQALMATHRGLALVADTQADQSVDQRASSQSAVAEPVPTTAVEAIPTVQQPKVVLASPPASSTVADKHDATHGVAANQPTEEAAAQTPEESSPTPQPQVAVGRDAPSITKTGHRDSERLATSQDNEKDDQHFEPVATDSGAIAQSPQISQQLPRHLDIALSNDSAQSDSHDEDARQVAVPATHGDDHQQADTEHQSQSGTNAPATNTARVEATQVPAASGNDQGSTSAHGDSDKSSHNDGASAAHGASDDHNGRSGGDQGGKTNADQSSKAGGDSGSRGGGDTGGHGGGR